MSEIVTYGVLLKICEDPTNTSLDRKVQDSAFSILQQILHANDTGKFLVSQMGHRVLQIFTDQFTKQLTKETTRWEWCVVSNFISVFALILADCSQIVHEMIRYRFQTMLISILERFVEIRPQNVCIVPSICEAIFFLTRTPETIAECDVHRFLTLVFSEDQYCLQHLT